MSSKRCNKSDLNYLYREGSSDEMIILLHGYGANLHDLFPIADYIDPQKRYNWFVPDAPFDIDKNYPSMRAWFPLDVEELQTNSQTRNWDKYHVYCPDELIKSLDMLEMFTNNLSETYKLKTMAGFSQGSMMAYHLLLSRKISCSKLTVFSGALCSQDTIADPQTSLNIFQSHGQQDAVLNIEEAMVLKEKLESKGELVWMPFSGGHEIPAEVLSSWWGWLNQAAKS